MKLIDPQLLKSPEALARFKREAKAAASIRSTHVVQILGYGVDDSAPYIAMELMKGESLAKTLERNGKLSTEFMFTVLTHVSRALTLAHDHGIVHRDLKPDNIFLVQEADQYIAKVLDFGVARQRGGLADSGGLHTQTGVILGTPYYMSPEQATGKPVDHLSDIWSFGVIAAECLTGRRPFEIDTLVGLFSAICIEPMPLPSQLGLVPAGFDAWFSRASARDKRTRFQSIAQAAAGLSTVFMRGIESPNVSSVLPQHGDTVVSSGTAVPAVPYRIASSVRYGLQTTEAPSTQSVPGFETPTRGKAIVIAAAAAATLSVVFYVGWRFLGPNEVPNTALASVVPTVTLPSSAISSLPLPVKQTPSVSSEVLPVATVEQLPVVSIRDTEAP